VAKNNKFKCVPAKRKHVDSLIRCGLRETDLMEIDATLACDPALAVLESWKASEIALAINWQGKTAAIAGVVRKSMLSDTGVAWMVGSKEFNGLEVARRSKQYILQMKGNFARLENFIDARQVRCIRWLKWCGFNFDVEPIAYGVRGMPFYYFWME
jgi:hypothetical protein